MLQKDSCTEEIWAGKLNHFMTKLKEDADFESASLFVFDSDSDTLKEVAKAGDGIDFISSIAFPMGNGLSAWVAQKGKVIYLPDIHRGSRHGLNPIRAYLSIPLEVNNCTIGVLNLGHTVAHAFDEPVMQNIHSLCRDIARKIYNHRYLNFIDHEEDNFAHR